MFVAIALGGLLGAGCTADFPPLKALPDGGKDAAPGPDAAQGELDVGPELDLAVDGGLGDRGPQDPDAGTDATPPDLGGGGGGEDAQAPDMRLPEDAGSLCVAERCNGADDDCDGQIDENYPTIGEPCVVGVGACRAEGAQVCGDAQDAVVCDAERLEGTAEVCDGLDNDCDGVVDNVLNLGGPCVLRGGTECEARGTIACAGNEAVCVGEAGSPSLELCDGLDNDCDGIADEAGDPCTVSQGQCARPGGLSCVDVELGAPPVCVGQAGEPAAELCDGLDNDCDGQADEAAAFNGVCAAGVGECSQEGSLVCVPVADEQGVLVPRLQCDAVALPPAPVDACDGLDNDCDGGIDEAFQVGQPCTVGEGACAQAGVYICGGDGDQRCDAEPAPPGVEACNGVDDDCDGRVDEGEPGGLSPCGDWVADHCRVWLGWVDNVPDPNQLNPIPTWGACPASGRSIGGDVACVNSGANRRFQSVSISGGMDDNDWLSVRFECDADGAGPWIDQHCQVALAYGDVASRDGLRALNPSDCGLVARRSGANPRCVRSGGDRLFHPLQTQGRVNDDDGFGIAFFCGGDDDDRAGWVQSSVKVFLGLYNRDTWFDGCWHGEVNNSGDWGGCPGSQRDNGSTDRRKRCVGASGGERFDAIFPHREVSRCDQFGVALLRAR